MITIIVPTYNEVQNIGLLIPKIYDVLNKQYDYEILIMDDNSPDGTAAQARTFAKKYPVRVKVRTKDKGLSASVIDGFKEAKGNILCVMDADLSHPPSLLPKLFKAIEDGADIAVGSRLVKGGGSESWPFHRKIISWGAQLLARPLTSVKDTMSGFFILRKDILKGATIEAHGYKILLEVLVMTKHTKPVEVPFIFLNRTFGQSKIGLKVEIQYLKQLCHLYKCKFIKKCV